MLAAELQLVVEILGSAAAHGATQGDSHNLDSPRGIGYARVSLAPRAAQDWEVSKLA